MTISFGLLFSIMIISTASGRQIRRHIASEEMYHTYDPNDIQCFGDTCEAPQDVNTYIRNFDNGEFMTRARPDAFNPSINAGLDKDAPIIAQGRDNEFYANGITYIDMRPDFNREETDSYQIGNKDVYVHGVKIDEKFAKLMQRESGDSLAFVYDGATMATNRYNWKQIDRQEYGYPKAVFIIIYYRQANHKQLYQVSTGEVKGMFDELIKRNEMKKIA